MLQRRSIERAGTTLAEVLVSASFLAVVASALLASTTQAHSRAARAERRLAALCEAKTQIAAYRSQAMSSALSAGTSSSNVTLAAIPSSVTLAKTVSVVGGYTNLFNVTVTLTWTDDSVSLQTYVRAPND